MDVFIGEGVSSGDVLERVCPVEMYWRGCVQWRRIGEGVDHAVEMFWRGCGPVEMYWGGCGQWRRNGEGAD